MEPLRFAGWTDAARAVIQRACERHGGEQRWRHLELGLRLRALSGLIPAMKGVGKTFPMPGGVLIRPSLGAAIFEDYPTAGTRAHFDGGAVWLEDSGGRRHTGAANHRTSFAGWGKWRRWEPLDALYFFGYALTHYHALPFTLPEGRLVRHRSGSQGDALTIDLPASLHTHCRRQTFHFDTEGLIQRHDYVADIVGWWARGAHFWRDYTEVGGFPVARTRHVVPRLGRLTLPPTALHAEVEVLTGS
jgi:hypothetical protein